MDEGWTRWLLEQVRHTVLRRVDPGSFAEHISERIDVVVFPDQSPRSHGRRLPARSACRRSTSAGLGGGSDS